MAARAHSNELFGQKRQHCFLAQAIVDELFERDPDGAMLAFADMMKKGIVMPAHLMDDNWHESANNTSNAAASMPGGASALFMDYAAVADNLGECSGVWGMYGNVHGV